MERLGHLLLAGAGLPGDEHRRRGGSHLAQLVEDAEHGGASGPEGLLQHIPALDLAEVADLLRQAALPFGQPGQVFGLLEAQGEEGGEDAHMVEHALGILPAYHRVEGHEAEGLTAAAEGGHEAAVPMGHLEETMEGVLAGIILLEGGGPGAGLEGVLQAEVAPHGDPGFGQLGRGQGTHRVGDPQAFALPQ